MRRLHILNPPYNFHPNFSNMEDIYTTSEVLSDSDLAMLTEIMDNALAEVTQNNTTAESTQEESQENEPIIPENSKTILLDEYTSRFNSAIWYDKIKTMKVILAGVGGIGSYIGFLLSRLQVLKLTLYDPDIVESVNISGQLYPLHSIGGFKADELARLLGDFSGFYNYNVRCERFTEDSTAGPIMICGFDNMAARKVFFESWKTYVSLCGSPEECLFIDGRLAAEEFQVLTIQGNDERAIKEYEEKWLFSDEEAEATVCSYKQTTFMANMIASVMVNAFVNFAANLSDPAPIIPRDIPFFISYSADTMFTKVEM